MVSHWRSEIGKGFRFDPPGFDKTPRLGQRLEPVDVQTFTKQRSAGERAQTRFWEFFVSNIRNPHTRRAYGRSIGQFLAWCERRGGSRRDAHYRRAIVAWPAHKIAGVRVIIEKAGPKLIYLPPYSPDLNPIEMMFVKLTALLRKAKERTVDELWDRIGVVLDEFTPSTTPLDPFTRFLWAVNRLLLHY